MNGARSSGGPPRVWVVSPVFYDVTSFLRLRDEIRVHLAGHDLRFVVVDDSAGADDEVHAHVPDASTHVVTPPFNLGHQRAIVFGLRAIVAEILDTDFVVTLDADGEDQPADVPRLLAESAAMEPQLEGAVLARRTERNESTSFRILYRAFRLLFWLMTGSKIRTGNFAVQRGWFLSRAIFHPSFDLCYSTTLLAMRRPVRMVPCARGRRYAGESKMNVYRLIAHGVRMMLPFAEQIAVRLLTLAAVCLALSVAAGATVALLIGFTAVSWFPMAVLPLSLAAAGFVSFVAFIILFSGFAQSSAIALQGVDAGRSRALQPESVRTS